ncbi:hypothetical protein IWW36_002821 [Coemansia brasiliensis]|uniref:Uncharacterized protein n=1 Tax=Coemansia brasiliensis TaxID=2650707 RepID=A0A9W8I6F2_9FUNG|nr:hypothetical protein IWW36_002821 [Coemansia brasiliensis]
MPPVDIYRAYYMAPHSVDSEAERAAIVSAIIKKFVAYSSGPKIVDRTTDVAVPTMYYPPCFQHSGYPMHRKHHKNCSCSCCGKRRHKSRHHHQHTHLQNQLLFNGQHQRFIESISQEHSPAFNTAFTEIICLSLSLLLSICLLLVGYKIGNLVCRYEAARDRGQGRGHKGSLARRQGEAAYYPLSKDMGVQCDEAEASPLLLS